MTHQKYILQTLLGVKMNVVCYYINFIEHCLITVISIIDWSMQMVGSLILMLLGFGHDKTLVSAEVLSFNWLLGTTEQHNMSLVMSFLHMRKQRRRSPLR